VSSSDALQGNPNLPVWLTELYPFDWLNFCPHAETWQILSTRDVAINVALTLGHKTPHALTFRGVGTHLAPLCLLPACQKGLPFCQDQQHDASHTATRSPSEAPGAVNATGQRRGTALGTSGGTARKSTESRVPKQYRIQLAPLRQPDVRLPARRPLHTVPCQCP
jgi:hypothetical protein